MEPTPEDREVVDWLQGLVTAVNDRPTNLNFVAAKGDARDLAKAVDADELRNWHAALLVLKAHHENGNLERVLEAVQAQLDLPQAA